MPNILGLITARGGSKGIPKKNIKLLGGHPLIAYTISAAKKCQSIKHVILSTDDEEIALVAKKYGVEVPFMRPANLASDTAKHVPVIQHAVEAFEEKNNIRVDYVVLFQPTSPFRLPEDIEETIRALIKTKADSAVSIVEMTDNHPLKAKKVEGGFVKPYFAEYPEPVGTRRQDLEKAYKRSGAVYAMTRETVMDKGELYGEKIAYHIVPDERSIDIDNEKDWVVAEYMLERLIAKGVKFI